MTFSYWDLFPDDDPPPVSPMRQGGVGRHFMYWSNRNVCTMLYTPREFDSDLFGRLCEEQPMGYSTMFILEKLGECSRKTNRRPSERQLRMERYAAENQPTSQTYCSFIDPARINMGGGAVGERFADAELAYDDARSIVRKYPNVRVLLCRVVESTSWH